MLDLEVATSILKMSVMFGWIVQWETFGEKQVDCFDTVTVWLYLIRGHEVVSEQL